MSQAASSGPIYSADGQWWWDGQQWRPVGPVPAQPAARSDEGLDFSVMPTVPKVPLPRRKSAAPNVMGVLLVAAIAGGIALFLTHSGPFANVSTVGIGNGPGNGLTKPTVIGNYSPFGPPDTLLADWDKISSTRPTDHWAQNYKWNESINCPCWYFSVVEAEYKGNPAKAAQVASFSVFNYGNGQDNPKTLKQENWNGLTIKCEDWVHHGTGIVQYEDCLWVDGDIAAFVEFNTNYNAPGSPYDSNRFADTVNFAKEADTASIHH